MPFSSTRMGMPPSDVRELRNHHGVDLMRGIEVLTMVSDYGTIEHERDRDFKVQSDVFGRSGGRATDRRARTGHQIRASRS
jgi:hypothetical protein